MEADQKTDRAGFEHMDSRRKDPKVDLRIKDFQVPDQAIDRIPQDLVVENLAHFGFIHLLNALTTPM